MPGKLLYLTVSLISYQEAASASVKEGEVKLYTIIPSGTDVPVTENFMILVVNLLIRFLDTISVESCRLVRQTSMGSLSGNTSHKKEKTNLQYFHPLTLDPHSSHGDTCGSQHHTLQ